MPLTLLIALACSRADNLAPTAPVIEILPAAPRTTDALEARVLVPATDPEAEALTYRWSWYLDGELVAAVTGDRVEPELTARGQRWRAVAQADDGELLSAPADASVDIHNAPPVAVVTLGPAEALTTDDLVADVQISDPDGDPVQAHITWRVDGAFQPDLIDATVPAARTARDERWEVQVLASDGDLHADAASASLTVRNTPPRITHAEIIALDDELPLRVASAAAALVEFEDDDGDEVSLHWAWTVDGVAVGDADTEVILGGDDFVKGQRVALTLTPDDGDLLGEPVEVASVVAVDTLPSGGRAEVRRASPTAPLTCEAVEPATDDDGDAISYSVLWSLDGAEPTTRATVPASEVAWGDTWSCALVPQADGVEGEPVWSAPLLAGGCDAYDPVAAAGWRRTYAVVFEGATGVETHTAATPETLTGGVTQYRYRAVMSAGTTSWDVRHGITCDGARPSQRGWSGEFQYGSNGYTFGTPYTAPRPYLPGVDERAGGATWDYAYRVGSTGYEVDTEGTYEVIGEEVIDVLDTRLRALHIRNTYQQSESRFGGPFERVSDLWYVRGVGLVAEEIVEADSGELVHRKRITGWEGLAPARATP